jgi:preprotein translocase subunit SecY
MIQTFLNIFKIPELRNKVLFTLFLLAIYRIGFHVPLPGTDQEQFAKMDELSKQSGNDSAGSRLANYVSLFSGGSLTQSTIFGLGIMPYISSSIIFQLLATVVPQLEKLQQEGESGRKKIQEWTRYAAVPICLVQAAFLLNSQYHSGGSNSLLLRRFQTDFNLSFWIMGIVTLTAGTIFLMWLGEQIDEYGLGNGISLIILAGIVARMPGAVGELIKQTNLHPGQPDANKPITPGSLIFLAACFCFIVAGSILITQAQRRIPIQQAKHTRGRHIYGGQRQYLPLRVNHGGVMPIIFAQSLMLFPTVAFAYVAKMGIGTDEHAPVIAKFFGGLAGWLSYNFGPRGTVYFITECAMIYFFAYFWTTVARSWQLYSRGAPGQANQRLS